MIQAKQLYKVKQWDQALYSLQKELRRLRGKPKIQKVPVYVFIGLCLYHKGSKGLAWKAFEQAFFIDRSAVLPPGEKTALKGFFKRARQRVNARLGWDGGVQSQSKSRASTPSTSVATGTVSPWPWVLFSFSAAALAGGAFLILNASANQGQLEQFLTSGVKQGAVRAELETSSETLRDSVGLQNSIGIIALSAGGASLVGAVILLVVQGKKKPKTATRSYHSPITPLATSSTILLQVD